jgi:hypothetical protein
MDPAQYAAPVKLEKRLVTAKPTWYDSRTMGTRHFGTKKWTQYLIQGECDELSDQVIAALRRGC